MIYKELHFFLQETISHYKKLSFTLAEKLRTTEDTFKAKKGRKENRRTLTQIPGFSTRRIFESPHPLSELNVST